MSPSETFSLHDALVKVIVEKSYSRIAVADRHGVFLNVAPNFAALYGGTAEDYVGCSAFDLEKSGILTPSVTAKVLREDREVQFMLTTRMGRTVLAQGFPVRDAAGSIVQVASFSYDMTDLHILREEYEYLQQRFYKQDGAARSRGAESEITQPIDPAMRSIFELVWRVARTPASVLFLGETGVGKTMFARLVHQQSDRRTGRLVELNCASLPGSLVEAELFGYESGAFTGARQKGKAGLIEEASGGTLFLDEISEASLDVQAKLLKALEDRRIMRVGATRERSVDFRLVAATNVDLEARVESGQFRPDLYYRLNVVPIIIPPLRQRQKDLPSLIDHLWAKIDKRYGGGKVLESPLIGSLLRYHWPGNVRELENVLERLYVTETGPRIGSDRAIRGLLSGMAAPPLPEASAPAPEGRAEPLPKVLARVERQLLQDAQKRHSSTYEMAASLGISQPSVVRKLRKHGL